MHPILKCFIACLVFWHKEDTELQGICEVSDHDRGWYNAICHVLNIIKQDLKGADNE